MDKVRFMSRLIAWQELFDVSSEAMLRLCDILESSADDDRGGLR